MRIPVILGTIDRRILINFTADPNVVGRFLPEPFRPRIFNGKAIVGICLIRQKQIRPKGFPNFIGVSSENGAHRFAVEWDENGETREGVYIPRRDTSLFLNSVVGGRLFPGKHWLAKFNVTESNGNYHIACTSSVATRILIAARETEQLPMGSIFGDLEQASNFFERGAIGFSPNGASFEGMELRTLKWKVRPLEVAQVRSSFFEDEDTFPKGSIEFDHALLMTKLKHEWRSMGSMKT